jgi:hypothetical protein
MARFIFAKLMFTAVLGTALPSLAAQFELEDCKSPDFQSKLESLMSDEEAIRTAGMKIVNLSAGSAMHNCFFMVPVENGVAIDGAPRKLLLEHRWDRIEIVNGVEKRVPQNHGMAVEYVIHQRPYEGGGVAIRREVLSFQVCRTRESCERFGIRSSARPGATRGKS